MTGLWIPIPITSCISGVSGMSLTQISSEEYLRKRHKLIFTSVVMPVIVILTAALAITHWRNEPDFYYAVALSIGTTILNVALSYKNHQIKTPFGVLHTRSDWFDCIRWCANLAVDAYLFKAMGLHVSIALLGWVVLSFGAMSEVYTRKFRMITGSVSIFGFVVVLQFYALTLQQDVLAGFICGSLLYIFNRFEQWLVHEMNELANANQERQKIAFEAEVLKREAVLGAQSRSICHEINNTLTVIKAQSDLMSMNIKDPEDPQRRNVERIRRAVGQLMKLTRVVMDDLGQDKTIEREYPLIELIDDFKTLLDKHFKAEPRAKFEFTSPTADDIAGMTFFERTGTTYLIAHNLVKNAMDACIQSPNQSQQVSLKIEIQDNSFFMIVKDSGHGMSAQMRENILTGSQDTTKETGHGLGMKFVVNEIRNNNMTLEIHDNPTGGTVVIVKGAVMRKDTQNLSLV